jgi:hypothetical protein
MIEDGTLVLVVLKDEKELIGKWSLPVDGYVELSEVGQIMIVPQPNAQGQMTPQKLLVGASDQGNFEDYVLVKEEAILYIKPINEKGNVYTIYKQAISNLVLPPKGVVLPFKPENKN